MRLLVVPLLVFMLAAAPESGLRAVFENAAHALSSGRLEDARRGFEQVLQSEPKHIGALGNLGVVYMRMERPAAAVEVYGRALQLAPSDPLLNLNIALAYLKQDDYAAAKPHLKKVLASRPGDPQATQLLATTQLFTDEVAAGIAQLEKLRGTDPSVLYFLAIGYLKQGRKDDAQQSLDKLFRSVSAAQASFLSGRAYYESTLFEEAIAALEKARQLDPALPGIDRELGKAYVSVRRAEDAERSLRAALRTNPLDPEALYFLGAELVQRDQPDEGIPLLEKARAARPNFWGTYYYLGKAHFEKGDTAAALPLLEKAARLNPNETAVFYQLARALRKAGRPKEAQRAATRVRELEAERRKREQLGTTK